jgi:predicted RNase H-like nuclease (RuvC/YqgF family)
MDSSKVVHKKRTAKEKRIAELKQSLKEAKEMAENIAAGNDNYETMDEFLERLSGEVPFQINACITKQRLQ